MHLCVFDAFEIGKKEMVLKHFPIDFAVGGYLEFILPCLHQLIYARSGRVSSTAIAPIFFLTSLDLSLSEMHLYDGVACRFRRLLKVL